MSYNIGDPGPAGGFIFATPQTTGNNTGFYFEAGPHDLAISQMPSGSYGYNCSSSTSWQALANPQNLGPGVPVVTGAAEFGWMKAIIPPGRPIPSFKNAGMGLAPAQAVQQGFWLLMTPQWITLYGPTAAFIGPNGAPYTTSPSGPDVGDGRNNTLNQSYITNFSGAGPQNVQAITHTNAHDLCVNYSTVGVDPISGDGPIDYKDWFLPSAREARLMMINIGPNSQYNQATKFLGPNANFNGVAYPNSNKYWTSTADFGLGSGQLKARIVDSLTGLTTNATRCHVYGVRPVRMFLLEEIEREYRCPGATGGTQCIDVPLGSTLPPLNAFQTLQDCNTALQNGDCGGGPDPCVPSEMDCYNYRDGIGGVNLDWTPRLTPIYTPGLSGSGFHTGTGGLYLDNVGNDYSIKTTWTVPPNAPGPAGGYNPGMTPTQNFSWAQWLQKFFHVGGVPPAVPVGGTPPDPSAITNIGSNQNWDSVVGLPWFNLNISKQDVKGNIIDVAQFKAQNRNGYLIKIWDKRKRLLGSWLYDNCQVMHPTVKYHKSTAPNSSYRNEIDMQCNSFPELCDSQKLRVLFTTNGGKLPEMIDGHHEHGKHYKIIQYGYSRRSNYLGTDQNYPTHHGQTHYLPTINNMHAGVKGQITTPNQPLLLNYIGAYNAIDLNIKPAVNSPNGDGIVIPSFGHRNEDYSDISRYNPNQLTNSYAYILIKCDYFDSAPEGYAHMNGPNTDEFHMNVICDETHGGWCGQNLGQIPSHNGKCGPSANFPSGVVFTFPYITGNKFKKVTNNCRNHGMLGNRAIYHAAYGTNTTGPQPIQGTLSTFNNFPVGCIPGDPTNPCLYQSFSSINLHPWFAQFKPGDGSVPGTSSTWTNITWYKSTHEFIYDNQATPTREPNMNCRHLTWQGTNITGSGTESEPGGRGESGEYVITEFNINEEHISEPGGVKQLSIVGDPFATFSLTITTDDTTVKYYNFSSNKFSTTYDKLSFEKLNSSGIYQQAITFPTSTSNVVYSVRLQAEPHFDTELQLSGVLSKISQTKKIYQYAKKKITFTSSSETSASVLTFPTDVEVDVSPSLVTIDDILTSSVPIGEVEQTLSWTYTVSNDKRIVIKRQPLIEDFESTITKTVDGVVDVGDATGGRIVTLNNVESLSVGNTITAVSSGSIIGLPAITAIDSTDKQITIDVGQNFADGIKLTFTGVGARAASNFNNTNFELRNLKATLNALTTTTTSNVSDSAIIPVNSISGIKPKALEKTLNNTFVSTTKITFNDNIDDLAVGQTLVEGKNLAGQSINGAPTIVRLLESDNAVILSSPQTFRSGTKLTFANTFVDAKSIDSSNKPYVERIEGSNVILSSNQNIRQGETLTFIGSSNSVTITANIAVKSMGENNITANLKIDNILKIS